MQELCEMRSIILERTNKKYQDGKSVFMKLFNPLFAASLVYTLGIPRRYISILCRKNVKREERSMVLNGYTVPESRQERNRAGLNVAHLKNDEE